VELSGQSKIGGNAWVGGLLRTGLGPSLAAGGDFEADPEGEDHLDDAQWYGEPEEGQGQDSEVPYREPHGGEGQEPSHQKGFKALKALGEEEDHPG
jgi:hypothetical protein